MNYMHRSISNRKGFSLMELMVSLGISGLITLIALNLIEGNSKHDMNMTNRINIMENFDKAVRANKKTDYSFTEKRIRNRKVCEMLKLKYVAQTNTCLVPQYVCCTTPSCATGTVGAKVDTPCGYLKLRDAMCDLEKRSRVPDQRFCL